MVVDKPIVVKLVYILRERERESMHRIYVCVEEMLCIYHGGKMKLPA